MRIPPHPYSWDYVQLPYNKGKLYALYDEQTTNTYFILVKPDGSVMVLDNRRYYKKYYNANYVLSGTISINKGGTAFTAPYVDLKSKRDGMRVLKSDGKPFKGNGKLSCDISPPVADLLDLNISTVWDEHNRVWFHARYWGARGNYSRLFYASLNCTGKPKAIKLPAINGQAVVNIGNMLLTRDKKNIVLIGATSAYKMKEIFLVDTKTMKVTSLVNTAQLYADTQHQLFKSIRIAISPDNSRLAYIELGNTSELYVKRVGIAGKGHQVTSNKNFHAKMDIINGLHWDTDDDLLFWVGEDFEKYDLFHFRFSTRKVVNLTKTGGTKIPFATAGKLDPSGGWISPNEKYTYFMNCKYPGWICNISAILNGTQQIIEITSALDINERPTNMIASHYDTGLVFFAARDASSKTLRNTDIYYFNQNTASKPVKITGLVGPAFIDEFIPDRYGRKAAFEGHDIHTYANQYIVHVMCIYIYIYLYLYCTISVAILAQEILLSISEGREGGAPPILDLPHGILLPPALGTLPGVGGPFPRKIVSESLPICV